MVSVDAELLARVMNVLIQLNDIAPPNDTLGEVIDELSEALKNVHPA